MIILELLITISCDRIMFDCGIAEKGVKDGLKYSLEYWAALDKMVSTSEIVIDRPKGTRHPKYPAILYEVDYGYLKDTTSMDGDGIDVWKGTDAKQEIDAIICVVDLLKKDSEIKILIGCTEIEKEKICCLHNNSEYMKGMLIRRKPEFYCKLTNHRVKGF